MDFTTFYNIVNGEKRTARDCYHGIDPTTRQEFLHHAPVATISDLDEAVKAAQHAFQAWSETTLEERRTLLQAFARKFLSYETEFINLLAEENGKPVSVQSN
jgi:acyl-CoA reductase-like NAD-dependent aldehyde dehydrogenase